MAKLGKKSRSKKPEQKLVVCPRCYHYIREDQIDRHKQKCWVRRY